MKQKLLFQRFFASLLLFAVPSLFWAYDFQVDGIYYSKSTSGGVYVTSGPYTGDVIIPSSVRYEGKAYSVEWIIDNAFSNCSGLTSISIPNSVTYIGKSAFYGCTALTSITIPNSVTKICDYAFEECKKLSTINFGDNIKSIGWGIIRNIAKSHRLYVNNKASCTLFTLWQAGYAAVYNIKTRMELPPPSISVKKTASSLLCERTSSIIDGGLTKESISITVNGTKITQKGRSIYVSGLKPDFSYKVQYDLECSADGSYTRKEDIKTEALVMNNQTPKVVSVGNVIIEATSNLDDAEENVGFEWRRTDWTSDFPSNTGIAYLYKGTMQGYIRNLYTEKLWKVRPYYISNNGERLCGEWVGIDPTNTSYFEPTVHTYAAHSVKGNQAQVKGYALTGTDKVTSQGFAYWKVSANTKAEMNNAPAKVISVPDDAQTVTAKGTVMEASLTGLEYNATYCYVAYATTSEGETFYGERQTFTTGEDLTPVKSIVNEPAAVTIEAIYDASGCKQAKMQRGLNLIQMNDGTTRKVLIK